MAKYRAARALMGKGRNAGEGAAGLFKEQRKDERQQVRGEEGETKEVTRRNNKIVKCLSTPQSPAQIDDRYEEADDCQHPRP